MKKSNILLLGLFFACLSSLPAQDFSDIDRDMDLLESLIEDTLKSEKLQQQLLEDLKASLNESADLIDNYESIIQERETLLLDLWEQLNRMSEIYRMQSSLSAKYERSSKLWRTFTLIAVPVMFGLGMWAGSRSAR